MSHTPTPWTIHYNDTGHATSVRGEKHHVCVIRTNNQQEGIANAKLIAAAPDLKQALETAKLVIEKYLGNAETWTVEALHAHDDIQDTLRKLI